MDERPLRAFAAIRFLWPTVRVADEAAACCRTALRHIHRHRDGSARRQLPRPPVRKGTVENNNGKIFRSPRSLAKDMGCNVKTAMAALADLQAKGWIVCTKGWERGYDGKGRTALFRLTMMPTTKKPATREPTEWEEGKDYPVAERRCTIMLLCLCPAQRSPGVPGLFLL